MFVEVIYGLISNSLGLLTDGAHMLLDCSAILIGLYSRYLTKKSKNDIYNFGYGRAEVLGTFINSIFLIFISIYIVFESIERSIQPRDIHGDNLILVSFLGLVVNLIGIYFFHGENGFHSHGDSGCNHSYKGKAKEHKKSCKSAADKHDHDKARSYSNKTEDISREGNLESYDSEIYGSPDSKKRFKYILFEILYIFSFLYILIFVFK